MKYERVHDLIGGPQKLQYKYRKQMRERNGIVVNWLCNAGDL